MQSIHVCQWFYGLMALVISGLAGAQNAPQKISASTFMEIPATRETVTRLREGGYALYIRHGYTDNHRPDREDQLDLSNCATQRVLSDAGRQLMRELGDFIRTAAIPVGEIQVSPMCRTKESAELAFGKQYKENPLLMYWTRMSPDMKKPRLEELRQLLSTPVRKGSNRVLIAHAPNLNDLLGFFVKPEGAVVIFAPKGNGSYEYVATIHPAMWAGLLK